MTSQTEWSPVAGPLARAIDLVDMAEAAQGPHRHTLLNRARLRLDEARRRLESLEQALHRIVSSRHLERGHDDIEARRWEIAYVGGRIDSLARERETPWRGRSRAAARPRRRDGTVIAPAWQLLEGAGPKGMAERRTGNGRRRGS